VSAERPGALLYCNEAAERLFGRRLEELEGLALSDWSALLSPADETEASLPPAALPGSLALHEERPQHRVIHVTGSQGRSRPVAITAFPVMRDNGRPLGAVAIMWDA
jgi:PAS domain S-box-containing protein